MFSLKNYWPALVGALSMLVLAAVYRMHFGGDLSREQSDWASFGNYLAGILGPFLMLLTVLLLIDTLRQQGAATTTQLRAYVFPGDIVVGKIGIDDVPGLETNMLAHVTIKNFGQTPARHVVFRLSWSHFESAIAAEDFPFADEGQLHNVMLPPGKTIRGPGVEIPSSVIEQIERKQRHGYVWGWIDYDDVFPANPRHRTEFAFEIEVRARAKGKGKHYHLRLLDRFNNWDVECERSPMPYRLVKRADVADGATRQG